MQLINSILFAAAALTTLTEARHWHYGGVRHHRRQDNMTAGSGASWSVPYSVPYSLPGTGSPAMQTPQAAAPSAASPLSSIVLTYTLGSGPSATVVTTTIAMTATTVRDDTSSSTFCANTF